MVQKKIKTQTSDNVEYNDDPAYLSNPEGSHIKNLKFQTIQPLNFNTRPCKITPDGKRIMIKDEVKLWDLNRTISLRPTVEKLENDAFNETTGFCQSYLNRVVPYDSERKNAEKLYIRVLGVDFKTPLFISQSKAESIGGGNKTSACLKVPQAGSLYENIENLDYFMRNKIEEFKTKPGFENFNYKDSLKLYEGDNEVQADLYCDWWVSWKAKNVDVCVDGKDFSLSVQEFNEQFSNCWYDITFAVEPWMRHSKGNYYAGLNYCVSHIDVRRFKDAKKNLVHAKK